LRDFDVIEALHVFSRDGSTAAALAYGFNLQLNQTLPYRWALSFGCPQRCTHLIKDKQASETPIAIRSIDSRRNVPENIFPHT
jgi:hypothetical protein